MEYLSYLFPTRCLPVFPAIPVDRWDMCDLSEAFDGFHASLKGSEALTIEGFTGGQQFFIAFGQNWASKSGTDIWRQIKRVQIW